MARSVGFSATELGEVRRLVVTYPVQLLDAWHDFFGPATDLCVKHVLADADRLTVELMAISVPLAWYPRLAEATLEQLSRWEVAGGGYGVHLPEIDEDSSTEGLLRGARAPGVT